MTISISRDAACLTFAIEGRIDTMTAPELDRQLSENLNGVTTLVLDFSAVAYISSAGLRVLLSTQKKMNKQGEMKLTGVNDDIREIFDITGFSDILTVE